MASNKPDNELEDVDIDEPLLVNDAESEADAILDEEELQKHIATSKAARRWRYIRVAVGGFAFLVLVGIFIRLSRWRRPFNFISHQQSHFFPEYESQRVKIRYGPFKMPGTGRNSGMKDFKTRDAQAPCQDCVIVWMKAGLEFLDGRAASVAEGMWLHHTVLNNEANTALHNCDKARRRQRFFASGNEMSIVDLSGNGTKEIGYWLGKGDTIYADTELMNVKEEEQTVALTITYEYIPFLPESFSTASPIWLDIGGCHSELTVTPDNATFEIGSPVWVSPTSGRVVTIVSHLHDGGVDLRTQRDGQDVCVSRAEYGDVSRSENHEQGIERSHITKMSECYDVGRMSIGEKWSVKADYDLEKHAPMLDEHGEPEPVMGIALVYVVQD